jgi:hypothetical protein
MSTDEPVKSIGEACPAKNGTRIDSEFFVGRLWRVLLYGYAVARLLRFVAYFSEGHRCNSYAPGHGECRWRKSSHCDCYHYSIAFESEHQTPQNSHGHLRPADCGVYCVRRH